MKTFYSHGKLLLTGEYVVLDGALSLATPTRFGQSLVVKKGTKGSLKWTSLDEHNAIWFQSEYYINQGKIEVSQTPQNELSKRLLQLLQATKKLNPDFLSGIDGYSVTTVLEFPRNWGLGTSSTLVTNLANWAEVDPYKLLEMSFGGSGYDIACAQADGHITYQLPKLNTEGTRTITSVNFNPLFKKHIYFVHLNQKQNSRDGIAHYRKNKTNLDGSILEVNDITHQILTCKSFAAFQKLIHRHEQTISNITKQTPIKTRLFSDFNGGIKSLGAWGGDFVMVASEDNPIDYFKNKGYNTILPYSKMIKN